MRTLALLSLSLTVVLGIPRFQLDVAQKPVLPRGDRSPVVGDWVPVQGHVVMENILPQFRQRPTVQEKAPVVPAEKVEQSPLVDSNPKPEDGIPVVKQKPEVQESPEVNVRPEGQVQVDPAAEGLVETEVHMQPYVQVDPDVRVEPEVHMQPDVLVDPEVHMQPGVQVEPDVQVEPEVHMQPDVRVEPEVHMQPDVQVDPDVLMESDVQVQVEPEVQMDPELELELTMSEKLEEQEEALVMEGEYMMVEEPIMELEPLAEDILNGKELNQEELSPEELSLRAEFQSELVEEPVLELEPLPEEMGLLDKREYVMAEEPVMELEPELSEERFEDYPIMPDTTVMEEEPVIELMGEQNAVGEYFLAEEPIMELKPEIQQVHYPMERLDTVIAEEPMMELEPLEGAKLLGEEEMVPVVGGPLYQQRVMGDSPFLDGGAHIGVEPEREMRALVDEGVEMLVENELQPEQDHRATRRWTCTGVVLEGKCYEFFRGPRQAADAEFFCQDHLPLGHLASITSSYIHRQVMNMMLQQNGAYTRTWVGGLRYLETGRFIWLDGSHWSYADWLEGEPNNTADVEDCVELLAVGNGKFNDMPCWDLRAFICSYPY